MDNLLCRKTIKELIYGNPEKEYLSCKFFIPSYQRGYRWKSTQVKQLIGDVMDFRKNKPHVQAAEELPFYCLQPLVVKKISRNNEIWYEVIDGQQRLTTLFIILYAINEYYPKKAQKQTYPIEYATRGSYVDWSDRMDEVDYMSNNIDYYHIHEAYEQAKDSIEKLEKLGITDAYSELAKEILDHTQIIWYEVADEDKQDSIDVFTRLNIGKIPLTNAELVKAMILQSRNFPVNNANTAQAQIAADWDYIEKTLQRKEFWGFIYDVKNPLKYDTRIEYIFDLMKDKTIEDDKNYTFDKFYEEYNRVPANELHSYISNLWLKIKNYFLTFEEWYNNREYYHYIGYLIETGKKVNEIKSFKRKDGSKPTKNEFLAYLVREIKSTLGRCNPDELQYGKKHTARVLLLFNIQTLLDTEKAEMRFPFHLYKSGGWDIEHIASKADFDVNKDNKIDWAKDMIEYFLGIVQELGKNDRQYLERINQAIEIYIDDDEEEDICRGLIGILSHNDKVEDDEFEDVYKKIRKLFEEDKSVPNKDFIYNLAILDSKTNRSYGNALFPIKRQTIIKNDAIGVFIPICTKNVFQKVYSRRLKELMHWSNSDAEAYLVAMNKTLSKFLPQPIKTNDNK